MKGDFYVCINTNDTTSTNNELDNIINSLEPIFYEKINIDTKKLISKYSEQESMFRDYNVFNTTWEEYKKTPFNKELNTLKYVEIKELNFLKSLIKKNQISFLT